MVITLEPGLAAVLEQRAKQLGVAPETLVVNVLRERFLADFQPLEPRDDWERGLLGLAQDCGVSLSNEALGREAMYD